MKETTWIMDSVTGALTVEGMSERELMKLASDLLPNPSSVNCARPINIPPLRPPVKRTTSAPIDDESLQVYRVYHGSVIEGAGRRSVVQVQGCSLHCAQCFSPQTHAPAGGVRLSITEVIELVLAPEGDPRDGVTVLGGEPFDQPDGLAALVRELKARRQHITLYSGYTIEELVARSVREPSVMESLRLTDVLIEGRFVAALSEGAGEWRGSKNQRLIHTPRSYLPEGS